jgi:hypothetical protein
MIFWISFPSASREGLYRRKIRIIEGNAKCRHLKTLTCKDTLLQVFISLRPEPHAQPLYTLYTVYLFTQGGGGGVG